MVPLERQGETQNSIPRALTRFPILCNRRANLQSERIRSGISALGGVAKRDHALLPGCPFASSRPPIVRDMMLDRDMMLAKTKKELSELAKGQGIRGYSKLRKTESRPRQGRR